MKQGKQFYEFGAFRIEENERLLRRGQEVVALPPKAAELLLALVERHGEAVRKEELLDVVWRGTFVEENSLAPGISPGRFASPSRRRNSRAWRNHVLSIRSPMTRTCGDAIS